MFLAYRRDAELTDANAKGDWTEPWDPADPLDVAAAAPRLHFAIGWFADPVYHGTYPGTMRAPLGDRLPCFTDEEMSLVKGSHDYYGMNHYPAHTNRHLPGPPAREDAAGNLLLSKTNKAGEESGPETQSVWLRPHAGGFRK